MCQCTTLLSNLMLLTGGIAVMLDESQYLWGQLIRLRRTPIGFSRLTLYRFRQSDRGCRAY